VGSLEILRRGFRGPRPGSNTFPLLQLGRGEDRITGEDLERLIRIGWLHAEPITGEAEIIKGGHAGPLGEIPDVDITHRYSLTDAGRVGISKKEH
jgi:hypothetical protein